jgi:hypothetical protein
MYLGHALLWTDLRNNLQLTLTSIFTVLLRSIYLDLPTTAFVNRGCKSTPTVVTSMDKPYCMTETSGWDMTMKVIHKASYYI